MRKMLLIAAAAALLAPVAALAKNKPPHPSQAKNDSQPAPTVLYILRGTVVTYTPAANAQTPGSIQIDVTSANRHGKAFKSLTSPTFKVTTSTKIVLHKHIAIASDDRVVVKVRYAKGFNPITGDLTAFENTSVRQIVDQGPKHANNGQGQNNSHSSTWLYVLHGKLSGDYGGSGPISITVTKANHLGKLLNGQTLYFGVVTSTKLGPAKATWKDKDHVIVKVVGPKNLANDVTNLTGTGPNYTPAKQVIDQGQ